MKFEETNLEKDWETGKEPHDLGGAGGEAALGALLESCGGDDEPERRAARLGLQLARLDALNVGGMLGAATDGGGADLAAGLERALAAGAALGERLRRYEAQARGAPDAVHARSDAARADAAARALLRELEDTYAWLDPPPLRDLDALPEIGLTTAETRARSLAACEALCGALRAERTMPAHRRRMAAVRDRLRRLHRAAEQTTAAVARHVNNLLIHLGNEAAAAPRRHAELLPLAPLMRCVKELDEDTFAGLVRVYAAGRARALEREVRAACEAARARLPPAAPPERAEEALHAVLGLVETLCDAEQDFCTNFFLLDVDPKGSGSGSGGQGRRGAGAESRRCMQAVFPALEPALLALTQQVERHDQYGAFRVLACVGRRVLDEGGAGGAGGAGAAGAGEARWARAVLAGVAVAAKRQADRAVQLRLDSLQDGVRAAQRRPKCGVLPFIVELEELSAACERIFAGSRRGELERWYAALARGAAAAVAGASHPRTPRAVLLLENYHRLHAALCALRVPALDALRRDTRARYADALRLYVTQYFGRPLEKLTLFFEGVAEAVAGGCREQEVCYRAAFSKHELRRVLQLYPAGEVRRALHRLYRTVDKHLSEEGGLLQVVWRAMQEEFLDQHRALQARIAACYPGTGLALPLSTQDILDAFSDIAREH